MSGRRPQLAKILGKVKSFPSQHTIRISTNALNYLARGEALTPSDEPDSGPDSEQRRKRAPYKPTEEAVAESCSNCLTRG
jgi:hypothetical protein